MMCTQEFRGMTVNTVKYRTRRAAADIANKSIIIS